MNDYKKLTHTIYECKYHVVFCPKYRFRIFQGDIAEYSRSKLYRLVGQKEGVDILELNIQVDHIHMVLSVAPKYSVSRIIGFLKGKLRRVCFTAMKELGRNIVVDICGVGTIV